MKKKLFIFSQILYLLLILGCPMQMSQNGSIKINILDSDSFKTFLPEIEMEIDYYTISGNGPNGSSLSEEKFDSTKTIDNLTVGSWDIEIKAYNSDNLLIGEGKAIGVNIVANKTTETSITVSPIQGNGTFNLNLTWDEYPNEEPNFNVKIENISGDITTLDLNIDSTGATGEVDLPNGYYSLNITVECDGYENISYVDTFRIVASNTTFANLDLELLPLNNELFLQIINNLNNPIEIDFSGAKSEFKEGEEMTVTASTTEESVDSYTWYLNGHKIEDENESTITIGSSYLPGFYNLTLIVRKDSIISSESIIFHIIETTTSEYKHVIMVYLDGDNNLEPYAIADLNEMEAVNLPSEDIKIIVLMDRISGYDYSNNNWTGTRLYDVKYDQDGLDNEINSIRLSGMGLTSTSSTELNMGDQSTLSDFINYCQSNYESELYSLILWNHGGGWRSLKTDTNIVKDICWDETNSNDYLSTAEVSSAIKDKNLSLLGFDACLMSMIEVGYEIKDDVPIMVASEETEPGDGWDYIGLLSKFAKSDFSANSLAKSIVSSYSEYYNDNASTLAAIDLTQIDSIISSLNTFAINMQNEDINTILTKRGESQAFSTPEYIDLYNFANNMSSVNGSSELLTAIENSTLFNWSHFSLDAHGLSIYFPQSNINSEYYTALKFAKNTQWYNFLNYFTNEQNNNTNSNNLFVKIYTIDEITPEGPITIQILNKSNKTSNKIQLKKGQSQIEGTTLYSSKFDFSIPDTEEYEITILNSSNKKGLGLGGKVSPFYRMLTSDLENLWQISDTSFEYKEIIRHWENEETANQTYSFSGEVKNLDNTPFNRGYKFNIEPQHQGSRGVSFGYYVDELNFTFNSSSYNVETAKIRKIENEESLPFVDSLELNFVSDFYNVSSQEISYENLNTSNNVDVQMYPNEIISFRWLYNNSGVFDNFESATISKLPSISTWSFNKKNMAQAYYNSLNDDNINSLDFSDYTFDSDDIPDLQYFWSSDNSTLYGDNKIIDLGVSTNNTFPININFNYDEYEQDLNVNHLYGLKTSDGGYALFIVDDIYTMSEEEIDSFIN